MGCLPSKPAQRVITGRISLACVHAETLAATMVRKHHPTEPIVPDVSFVELVRGPAGQPGACWVEHRRYAGRNIAVRKTLTHIQRTIVDTPENETTRVKFSQTMEVVDDEKRWNLIPHFFVTFTFVLTTTIANKLNRYTATAAAAATATTTADDDEAADTTKQDDSRPFSTRPSPPSTDVDWSYAFIASNAYASCLSSPLYLDRLEKTFVAAANASIQAYYTEALRRTIRQQASVLFDK